MTESPYVVLVLAEQTLSAQDTAQVFGLHEELRKDTPVAYHLLIPVEDAAARVEGAMTTLGEASFAMPTPVDMHQVEQIQSDLMKEARASLESSLERLRAAGATADGELLDVDPVEGLRARVGKLGANEVIVLTRPHVVAEFFHLDWTSRARRHLKVPVLHLLEHENFDEQGEEYGGEGVTGF